MPKRKLYPLRSLEPKRKTIAKWIEDHSFKDPITFGYIPPPRVFRHVQPAGVVIRHDCLSLMNCITQSQMDCNPLTRVPFNKCELKRLTNQCRKVGRHTKCLWTIVCRQRRTKRKTQLYEVFLEEVYDHAKYLKNQDDSLVDYIEKLFSVLRLVDSDAIDDFYEWAQRLRPDLRSVLHYLQRRHTEGLGNACVEHAIEQIFNHRMHTRSFKKWIRNLKGLIFGL